ncbi:MAG: cache domain-containing protein, partial [Spirochaetales bacterium]|nr:cache domain-containing protein [Spirochaetales bacterium]
MNKKKRHIGLVVEILIATLVPLVTISTVLLTVYTVIIINRIKNETLESSKMNIEKLCGEVQRTLQLTTGLVNDATQLIHEYHRKDVAESIILSSVKTHKEFFALYYATVISRYEQGGFCIYYDWDPPPTWVPSQRPWWKAAVANYGNITFSDPYVDAQLGGLCITVAKTVSDSSGNLIGCMGADIDVGAMVDLVNNYRISESSKCYIIKNDGLYITHPDSDAVMNRNYFDESDLKNYGVKDGNYLRNETYATMYGDKYYVSAPV